MLSSKGGAKPPATLTCRGSRTTQRVPETQQRSTASCDPERLMFEVDDTMAIVGTWNHNAENCGGPYSSWLNLGCVRLNVGLP